MTNITPGAFIGIPPRISPPHCSLQVLGKPSGYETEFDFMTAINDLGLGCTRHYYLKYYEFYVKAAGRLPQPHWTAPAVPAHDATHDEYVRQKQEAHRKYWEELEAKWAKEEERRQAAEAAESAANEDSASTETESSALTEGPLAARRRLAGLRPNDSR